MLHQTLIPSSSLSFPSVSASPSSSPLLTLFASNAKPAAAATTTTTTASALLRSSSSAMPSYAHHHSSLDERMDALKGSSRQEESAEDVAAAGEAPAAWGFAERDGFSVEDLLDLEEFCEPDKDGADEHEEPPVAEKQDKCDDGSQQSAVSFEVVPPAPPVPEIVDLPAHDAEELEWVSRIMDDSLSELPPQPAPPASMMASLAARPPQHRLLQLRHPQDGAYRALPSLASDPLRTPTICALSTEALVPVKAKRSKRSRASAWSLSGSVYDSASSSSTTTTSSCSSSASFSPYFLLDSPQLSAADLLEEYDLLTPPTKKSKHGKSSKHKPKKRGRKPKHLPPHPSMASPTLSDRRCSHCGVQKTPQWRAGPEGAKTLCNACGVRYKSGRLLPEYRPACSPTFVSTVHSNSHRKVLEMRRKKEDGPLILTTAPAVASF